MILSCNHISKSYGVDTILDDCSFFETMVRKLPLSVITEQANLLL